MSVNQEKVATLLGEIRKSLGVLEGYRTAEDAALLESQERLGNIKYQFIIAIEACIDLCNHFAAQNFVETPESYSHCFELLGKHRVIDSMLAAKMAELARFRNLLVHLYWKVDDARVIEILKTELPWLQRFVESVAQRATGEERL